MNFISQTFGNPDTTTYLVYEDESDHIFVDCTFVNCEISSRVPYLEFDKCHFLGNFKVNNKGTGDLDTVRILNIEDEGLTDNLQVSSSTVAVHDCHLTAALIKLCGSELEIINSRLEGKTQLEYLDGLTITESQISELFSFPAKGYNTQGIIIEKVLINGSEVNNQLPPSTDNKTSSLK